MTIGKVAGRRFLPGLTVRDGLTRHPFDEEFGVRTSGLVAGRHLKSGHPHDRHATAYYGVAPSVFRALMRRWKRSRLDWAIKDVSFIDIGAGMGRAVLLAAQMPFRQVVGVELNPTLARIAKKNLTAWRASGRALAPMKVICGDAVDYRLPTGPCLAFMFNPFGAPVMRRLLQAWRLGLTVQTGELDLIYVNNEQEHVLESERSRQPGFVRLFLGQVPRSRADAIADHKILSNQPEGEYASANYEDCSIWRWRSSE
jgi:SAM-dependent methyltransferase